MPRFSIGIDLGTTNCVVAYVDLEQPDSVSVLEVPQITAPNQVESQSSLPSFLYVPTVEESESTAFDIPDAPQYPTVNGAYARSISAERPERTVSASKSWLCHGGTDRHAAILPWGHEANDQDGKPIQKISPVVAARILLRQIADTWEAAFPEHPLAEQLVTLTVPASFDLSARELTKEAAAGAGLPAGLILLEEPQAAIYHWLEKQGDNWREQLAKDELLVVVDVGGGTTDLTLVRVEEQEGNLELNRVAVGNHLLVGGDNMDLTLAHFASQKFAEKGTKLNPWQSISLWHACRKAKESLLDPESTRETEKISILGRGSRLIGGTVSIEVQRDEVQALLIDGFLPLCEPGTRPVSSSATGFQEIGLPYEQDTAVTRHVSAFFADHLGEGVGDRRVHLLLNGGVFKAPALRQRMNETASKLLATQAVTLGDPQDLDFAVARGAAFYGKTKYEGGIRIRGGTPRSYYVGIESAGLAIPGMPRPLQAVCVVPYGMEEGTEKTVPGREVGLVLGRPATFRFFSSAVRHEDEVGFTLKHWEEEELQETSPMVVTLEGADGGEETNNQFEPVRFLSRVSELGMLELWCQSTRDSEQQWKLELNVREEAVTPDAGEDECS